MSNVNNGNGLRRWEKLEELLEVQNEILTKHFGYSNEMDVLEDIRNELSEEIEKNKMTEPVDGVTAQVMGMLAARSHKGVRTYNASMDREDLSTLSWMIHLHEELLDASLYLMKMINIQVEIEKVQEAQKESNDSE